MARQMARLVPQERQTFAADVPEQPPTEAHTQDSRPVEDRHSTDRSNSERPMREARDNRESSTDADRSEDASDEQAAKHTHQRSKAAAPGAQHTDLDALLAGLMQGAPVTPLAPVAAPVASLDMTTAVATPETAGVDLAHTAALQTVALSPHMHIITDPKQAPSPESLAAFAKSMGLDESAIQNLLAQTPVTPAAPATLLASTTGEQAAGLTAGLPPTAANALQATMSSTLQGANQGNADQAVTSQLAAMAASAQGPVAASGAGLAAAATTLAAPALPGLTPTDMAAIQQLQITVLPAAVLPVNTAFNSAATNAPLPSTLDMLSLLGTGVDEKDVSALLSRFSEDAGSDGQPDQQSPQGDSNNFSSFAQALNRSNNAANAAAANASPTSANMSEVYDQLSDKMATEMAARMHKQLSDGEWKMKFALRPSNLGGVEIQLEMKDGKLDAVFRADNPLTRDLLQNSSQRLREALGNFGINAGQVNVGQGGGNAQQNNSGGAGKRSQVRDNSSSQVNGTGSASGTSSARNKANASLLDLYA